jgi:hypothetical protein
MLTVARLPQSWLETQCCAPLPTMRKIEGLVVWDIALAPFGGVAQLTPSLIDNLRT